MQIRISSVLNQEISRNTRKHSSCASHSRNGNEEQTNLLTVHKSRK